MGHARPLGPLFYRLGSLVRGLALGIALAGAGVAAERTGCTFLVDLTTPDGQHVVLAPLAEPLPTEGAQALRGIPLAMTTGGDAWVEPPPAGQGWRLVRDPGAAVGKGPRLGVRGGSGPIRLVLPGADGKPLIATVGAPTIGDPEDLIGVRAAHYRRLAELALPGRSWFRLQAADAPRAIPAWRRESLIDATFGLPGDLTEPDPLAAIIFGGAEEPASIPIAQLDPPAASGTVTPASEDDGIWGLLPADRPAVVASSLRALVFAVERADAWLQPLGMAWRGVALDRQVVRRLEFQLALDIGQLLRLLEKSGQAALVIDDGDLANGTGVCLLLTTRDQALLIDVLQARWAAQAGAGAVEQIKGQAAGLAYRGAMNPDRSVHTLLAKLSDEVLAVSNSPETLAAVVKAANGSAANLASQGDVLALRKRVGKSGATVMVPQAAVQRWASAAYAIGTSRRVRARAALHELQGIVTAGAPLPSAAKRHPELGEITVDRGVVHSQHYGSLRFITPISERLPQAATAEEAAAWRRWRDSFNRRGGWAFPMALRFAAEEDGSLSVDLALPGNGKVQLRGAPPSDAPLVLGGAIERLPADWKSRLIPWKPGAGDPLSQGDGTLWLWSEGPVDPVTDPATWPLVLRLGASDSRRTVAQLKGLMDLAKSRTVEATFDDRTKRLLLGPMGTPGGTSLLGGVPLIAAGSPDGILLTTQANAAALDKALARAAKPLASQALIQLTPAALPLLTRLEPSADPRLLAWGVLPILSEWKRRSTSDDPAALHEQRWCDRPVDPAGSPFAWEAAMGVMTSAAYGSPWSPKDGPALPDPWRQLPRLSISIAWSDLKPAEPAR